LTGTLFSLNLSDASKKDRPLKVSGRSFAYWALPVSWKAAQ
jgi:hypothetical protein